MHYLSFFAKGIVLAMLVALSGLFACSGTQVLAKTNPIDGQVRVRVPSGEFLLGTSNSQGVELAKAMNLRAESLGVEGPQQMVSVAEFYIDRTPVTNAQFKKFLDANPKEPVPFLDDPIARSLNWDKSTRTFPAARDQYPVVLVTWHQASAYCVWAGGRLPTEAEWEKAARGTDGRTFPWGNEWDASKLNSAESRREDATPVGQFPQGASPYGALDMVGNVWQWTSSLDKPYPYNATDGREDPNAPGMRITRGGAWLFGAAITRTATRNRFEPDGVSLSLGFRCAQ